METLTKPLLHDAVDAELDAYNAAFYQLGLRWYWDRNTYERLQAVGGAPVDRLQRYLEVHQPHLLTAYDAEFLANIIEEAKDERRKAMRKTAPSARSACDWAELGAEQVGV